MKPPHGATTDPSLGGAAPGLTQKKEALMATTVPPKTAKKVAELPEHLRKYARLTGQIRTAPLDLAAQLDRVWAALKKAGWLVVPRSIGTDFTGPGGLPVPKSQPFEVLLHRKDRPYALDEAKSALATALKLASLDYSPTGAWLQEIKTEVAVPTLKTIESGVRTAWDWKLPALAVVGAVFLYRLTR